MFKGFIRAQKQLFKEFKETWKFMLIVYITMISINLTTGVSMDIIVNWYAIGCVILAGLMLVAELIKVAIDKLNKKEINKN